MECHPNAWQGSPCAAHTTAIRPAVPKCRSSKLCHRQPEPQPRTAKATTKHSKRSKNSQSYNQGQPELQPQASVHTTASVQPSRKIAAGRFKGRWMHHSGLLVLLGQWLCLSHFDIVPASHMDWTPCPWKTDFTKLLTPGITNIPGYGEP